MGEFFHGWRRKVGCFSLVMACVFVGFWIRSSNWQDMLRKNSRSALYGFYSRDGRLEFERFVPGFEKRSPQELGVHFSSYPLYGLGQFDITADRDMNWRWDWAGFHFGMGWDKEIFAHHTCVVPYWSIVVPLTLFSAWLVLAKPRLLTRKSFSEFNPEKAA